MTTNERCRFAHEEATKCADKYVPSPMTQSAQMQRHWWLLYWQTMQQYGFAPYYPGQSML